MDPIETLLIDDSLIRIDPVFVSDADPRDSFDGPGPSLAPDLDVTDLEPDDVSFLDDPDDDEERDDEITLALLIEFGVDFDSLDDPDDAPSPHFGEISDLVRSEEADDEVAA
jgi:hypothetical protein